MCSAVQTEGDNTRCPKSQEPILVKLHIRDFVFVIYVLAGIFNIYFYFTGENGINIRCKGRNSASWYFFVLSLVSDFSDTLLTSLKHIQGCQKH